MIDKLYQEQTDFDASIKDDEDKLPGLKTEADTKKAVLDSLTSAAERDLEAIKVAAKDSKDAQKTYDIAVENLEKKRENFRREQLTKIGCKPDNHPAGHTAIAHLTIKREINDRHLSSL